MRFKFKGESKVEIPNIGIVEPGMEFHITNEELLPIFTEELFETIKDVKPAKMPRPKQVKKEGD